MEYNVWFNKNNYTKNYSHFDRRIKLEKMEMIYKNKNLVCKHAFFPFIKNDIETIKFSNGRKKTKKREICYCSHKDRTIYMYYSWLLNNYYNEYAIQHDVNDCAIAYRTNLKKNNINFAEEVFHFISNCSCTIIVGDFTNFFNNINHFQLKNLLLKLLNFSNAVNDDKLPLDYYTLFKNITKYSMVELKDILTMKGFQNSLVGITKLNKLSKIDITQEIKNGTIKVNKNKKSFGIPQGSPISAILSNIFMLEFDRELNSYSKSKGGLYRRYSDDFIIVIPNGDIEEMTSNLNNQVNLCMDLELNEDKTFHYTFDFTTKILKDHNSNEAILDYLGFTFNGNTVEVRGKTTSKYYYRMYRKAKVVKKVNNYNKRNNKRSIVPKELYQKYSVKGLMNNSRGNFISYIKRSKKIFGKNLRCNIELVHLRKIKRRIK